MRKLYVLLLSLCFGVLAAPSTYAADNGSWSVYPAASQIAARPYFYLSADPGQTIQDKVVVANKTAKPLTFRLYAADAYNTARDGGFAVRTMTETMRGVGAWAKPAKSRVTVPAHKAVTVPFTLHVPEGAEPGDHPGALVALDERVDKGDGSLALGVQRAVGARVYLRVSGPTLPALAVEHVQVSSPAAGTGVGGQRRHDLLHAAQHRERHPRPEGDAEGTGPVRPYAAVAWTDAYPGRVAARAAREADRAVEGVTPTRLGDVTLTASAPGTRQSASASFFALPWLAAALLLAVGFVGGALAVRARRGRVRPSEPVRPSRPGSTTPSRPRSSPSARP